MPGRERAVYSAAEPVLFRGIRAGRPQRPHFPVILITGFSDLQPIVSAVQVEAADFILKPIETSEAIVIPIRRAVAKHRLHLRNEALEQSIRRSEARFRSFAALLPEIMFEADASGRLVFLNLAGS